MAAKLKGDASFSYAYEHYLDTVYRVAVHNAPTPGDAEDVTQEVFEALLRSGKAFGDGEHLKAWLIRVTINRCKNLHRARRRNEVALSDALEAPQRPGGLRAGGGARPSCAVPQRHLPALLRGIYRRGDRRAAGDGPQHGAHLARPGA